MIASDVLRRIIANGPSLDVETLGALIGLSVPSINGQPVVAAGSGGVVLNFFTGIIDLVTPPGPQVVVPPMPYRLRITSALWEVKTKGGTVSVSPTFQGGTNAPNFNDYYASQTVAAFTTQAAETAIGLNAIVPNPYPNLTTSGFQMNVTAGATGSSPVLTARFLLLGSLLPV